jgi:hypothetical protein
VIIGGGLEGLRFCFFHCNEPLEKLPATVVRSADRLAAGAAFLRAFVLGHVLIETGKTAE